MVSENIKLPFKRIKGTEDLPPPSYMTSGSAGMDIYAAVEDEVIVQPGTRFLVPTGLMVAVPPGYELQIRPRSGLAVRQGVGIVNSPGTIDSDYRGEIKVILINLGQDIVTISRGDRIAQMVICPVPRAVLEEVDELPPTERDDGGFGHTG